MKWLKSFYWTISIRNIIFVFFFPAFKTYTQHNNDFLRFSLAFFVIIVDQLRSRFQWFRYTVNTSKKPGKVNRMVCNVTSQCVLSSKSFLKVIFINSFGNQIDIWIILIQFTVIFLSHSKFDYPFRQGYKFLVTQTIQIDCFFLDLFEIVKVHKKLCIFSPFAWHSCFFFYLFI